MAPQVLPLPSGDGPACSRRRTAKAWLLQLQEMLDTLEHSWPSGRSGPALQSHITAVDIEAWKEGGEGGLQVQADLVEYF